MAGALGASVGILLRFVAAYPEVPLAMFCFFFFHNLLRRKAKETSTTPCFPIVGMLPSILLNLHRVHDFVKDLLEEKGCTAWIRGPWLSGMDFIASSDPAVAKYVTSTRFNNFIRSPRFREILEPLGDGVISSDFDEWRVKREIAQHLLHRPMFQGIRRRLTHHVLESRLLPLLAHVARAGGEKKNAIDLQDILQRFTFDIMCFLVFGVDAGSLSTTFPAVPLAVAVHDAEDAIVFRYAVPRNWWRLLRWLRIGPERKMAEAMSVIDEFIYQRIASRKELISIKNQDGEVADIPSDLLTEFIKNSAVDETGWQSTSVALAWLLWLVYTHPSAETRILHELTSLRVHEEDDARRRQQQRESIAFDAEEVDSCVYLNAVVHESLRLFPPVPLNPKCAFQQDVLPTGEKLKPDTMVLLSPYAMGRMEKNWGKDAAAFKPERWISERGLLREESSYKFGVFGSGPRICLGKTLALATIKAVAASFIYNFHFSVAEGFDASPKPSTILHMKNGLKGTLRERW